MLHVFIICFLGPEIRPALPFKCDKCAKTYKTKNTLSRHLKYECQMDPSFPCALCDYRTKLRGNLRGHLMAIHNVDRSQFTAFGAAGWFLAISICFAVVNSFINFVSWFSQHRLFVHYSLSNVKSAGGPSRTRVALNSTWLTNVVGILLFPATNAIIGFHSSPVWKGISLTFMLASVSPSSRPRHMISSSHRSLCYSMP